MKYETLCKVEDKIYKVIHLWRKLHSKSRTYFRIYYDPANNWRNRATWGIKIRISILSIGMKIRFPRFMNRFLTAKDYKKDYDKHSRQCPYRRKLTSRCETYHYGDNVWTATKKCDGCISTYQDDIVWSMSWMLRNIGLMTSAQKDVWYDICSKKIHEQGDGSI